MCSLGKVRDLGYGKKKITYDFVFYFELKSTRKCYYFSILISK